MCVQIEQQQGAEAALRQAQAEMLQQHEHELSEAKDGAAQAQAALQQQLQELQQQLVQQQQQQQQQDGVEVRSDAAAGGGHGPNEPGHAQPPTAADQVRGMQKAGCGGIKLGAAGLGGAALLLVGGCVGLGFRAVCGGAKPGGWVAGWKGCRVCQLACGLGQAHWRCCVQA